MSWLESGRGRIRNNRSKNSETARVQKRLDSVIEPMRDKVNNSLRVDSTSAIVFKRTRTGLPCSCTKVDVDMNSEASGTMATASDGKSMNHFSVESSNNKMFGGALTSFDGVDKETVNRTNQPINIIEMADMASDPNGGESIDYSLTAIAGSTRMCGICFGQGFQPAYQPANWHYNLMTHHHIKHIEGYMLNVGRQPAYIERITEDGIVVFDLTVPKFFKEFKYSIRNDGKVLPPTFQLWRKSGATLEPLTNAMLDRARGSSIEVAVREVQEFTHVVALFDLGIEPIHVNMSEEQNILNYDQELTVGDLTLVMSANVGNIQSEDLIVLPEKGYVIKANAAPKRRTAKGEHWEWVVTGRVVQRKEFLFSIFKGYKLWK